MWVPQSRMVVRWEERRKEAVRNLRNVMGHKRDGWSVLSPFRGEIKRGVSVSALNMEKKYIYKNTHKLKEIRQSLRANPTKAEEILWQHLRRNQLGYKFRRQFSINSIVVDFYSEQLKLVIEIDGWTHDFKKIQLKDARKQKMLTENGYKVIRYTNEQIYGDIGMIVNEIKNICDSRASFPS